MSADTPFEPPTDREELLEWLSRPLTRGEALIERTATLDIISDVLAGVVSEIGGDSDRRTAALRAANDSLRDALGKIRAMTDSLKL